MSMCVGPSFVAPRLSAAGAPRKDEEVGADKTVSQHAGNAGFAAVSVLTSAASKSRVARMVPGLNLAVGVLETYNAISNHRKGEPIVAMGHAGNATGCMAAFLEDAARITSLTSGAGMPHALGAGVIGLGIAGGLFGIVQGFNEIRIGRALKASTGSARTLKMGISDFASGTLTLAGIAMRTTGMAPAVGTALLVGASVCDLVSIAVDYFDQRKN